MSEGRCRPRQMRLTPVVIGDSETSKFHLDIPCGVSITIKILEASRAAGVAGEAGRVAVLQGRPREPISTKLASGARRRRQAPASPRLQTRIRPPRRAKSPSASSRRRAVLTLFSLQQRHLFPCVCTPVVCPQNWKDICKKKRKNFLFWN